MLFFLLGTIGGMSLRAYFLYLSIPFVIVFVALMFANRKYRKQDSKNYSNDFIGAAVVFGSLLTFRENERSVTQKLHWIDRYLRKRFPNADFNVVQIYQDVVQIGVDLPEYTDRANERLAHRQKINLMEFLIRLGNANGSINLRESEFIHYLLKRFQLKLDELDQEVQDLLTSRKSAREPVTVKKQVHYFQVLGVEADASLQEVKSAYRKLVKIYHPDNHRNLNDSEKSIRAAKFLEIQQAYEMISSGIA